MSGGSHDYVYCTLTNALGIPSGSYGIGTGKYDTYKEDSKYSRRANPMHDRDLSEMMYDVSCLLHSLEWFDSSDTGEEQYIADVNAFKSKWFCRKGKESYEDYKEDLVSDLEELLERIKNDGSTGKHS